ncbi:MAG: GNAT family N-acetyltransferase [Acidimicrobiia bacterium]
MVPEEIRTQRLVLRRFHRRDAEALAEAVLASIDDLTLWLPWASPDYRREDAVQFIRDSMQAWREAKAHDFGIGLTGDPRHVGNASIWHVSRANAVGEIGYWIRSDKTSRGVATEATERLLRLGFEEMGMHRITLRIAVGNRASERVAEKLGFTMEGVLRQELRVAGRWLDHTIYSMLEHEFHRQWGRATA